MAKHIFRGKVYGTTEPATTTEAGVVKPDGITTETDESGVISVSGDLGKIRVAAIAVTEVPSVVNTEATPVGEYIVVCNGADSNDGKLYSIVSESETVTAKEVTIPFIIDKVIITSEIYDTTFALKTDKYIEFLVG